MSLSTAQWPTRYEGLVAIRDLKIRMAKSSRLSSETVEQMINRAHDEFHASIADEMARRAK